MRHRDAVMLCGSCFTEHIGVRMEEAKMDIRMNPQGILFNPMSMAKCLEACVDAVEYKPEDLFLLNEIWSHWDFHSRYSNTDKTLALNDMNRSISGAHHFLKKANWLILTFGSSFQYFLKEENKITGVGNCHKAPGHWFEKRMFTIAEMQQQWHLTLKKVKTFNPDLKIIFTISPVRHYRDGLVENNRSKARLFELVQDLTEQIEGTQYFPAYEIVNDVLRDHRYFEADMVHPNQQAVDYVWAQFCNTYFNPEDKALMQQIKEITTALHHKPRFPETESHKRFQANLQKKIDELKNKFTYLNFDPNPS